MENTLKKCSQKKHIESKAISYCQQCEIYMCNKCENVHSELCQNHSPYRLNKDIKNIFTGICFRENHLNKLEYFCKTHNELCCAVCISKIKGKGNGQHADCNVCYIEDIKDETKNKLEENMKSLENYSKTIDSSINELKKIFEKVKENKEKLKLNIQKIFTKIRNTINDREDEILLEVDKKYDDLFFKEEFVKEIEKLPKRINESIKQGNITDKDWNEKKLYFLINDCINIEKDIKDINTINKNVEKCNNMNSEIKFDPEENDKYISEFLLTIKKFGSLHNDNKEKSKKKEELKKENYYYKEEKKEKTKKENYYYKEEKKEEPKKENYYYKEEKKEEPKKENYYYKEEKKEEPKKQYYYYKAEKK